MNKPLTTPRVDLQHMLDLTDCGSIFEALLDQLHEMTSLAQMIGRNGREGTPRTLLHDFHEFRHALTEDIHSLRGIVESLREELEKMTEFGTLPGPDLQEKNRSNASVADLDPNDDPVELEGFAVEGCLQQVRDAMTEITTIGDESEDLQRPLRAFKLLQGLQDVEQQLSKACERERTARRERFAKERAKEGTNV